MNLRSEILFNRALLWLLMGAVVTRYGEHRELAFVYTMLAVLNFWKSYKAWEVPE